MRHSRPGQLRAVRLALLLCFGVAFSRVAVAGSESVDPGDTVEEILRVDWPLKIRPIHRLGKSGAPDVLWALDEVERLLDTEAPPSLPRHLRRDIREAIFLARARLRRPVERGGEADRAYLRGILEEAISRERPRSLSDGRWAAGELCDLGRPEELPLVREYWSWRRRKGPTRARYIARAEERSRLAAMGEEGYAEALRSEEAWKRNWMAEELAEVDPETARRVLRGLLSEIVERARALVARDAPRQEHLAALVRWSGPYTAAYRTAKDLGCLDFEGEFYIPQYLHPHH